jgi:hypothetical protein
VKRHPKVIAAYLGSAGEAPGGAGPAEGAPAGGRAEETEC